MSEYERFVGPLPKDVYDEVVEETNLFRQDSVVELAARTLYGQRMAELSLVDTRRQLEKYRRDPLTKLLQRGPFIEEADAIRAKIYENFMNGSEGHNLALMFMLDLKRLKKINKKGGHPAGDKAVSKVGERLRSLTQPDEKELYSIAGRLGGDEFGVLVTFDTRQLSLDEVTDIISKRLDNIGYDNDIPHGLRVGDAVVAHPLREAIDLFAEADPKIPKSRKQKLGKFTLDLWHSSKRGLASLLKDEQA